MILLQAFYGYNGVVITDAFEMDAINKHFDKYDAAKLAINAGVDIILTPVETTSKSGFEEMDEYIKTLAQKADNGEISMDKINAAVLRILTLKENNGLLDSYIVTDIEKKVENAVNTVGTKASHEKEFELTKKAITLVKNDNNTLPLTRENERTVVLVPYNNEVDSMVYGLQKLTNDDKTPDGVSRSVLSYYKQTADDILPQLEGADNVVFVSEIYGASGLTNEKAQLADVIEAKVHSDGGKFIVLSNSLPYDAARFQKADAIMLAYLDAGMSELPKDKETEIAKYGPNMPAAMYMMFSAEDAPTAKLPINIPQLDENYSFTNEVLYARGFGLTYEDVPKTVDINTCSLTGIKNKTYTGKIITLNYTLKDGDKKLVLGTDYIEVYENSLIAGKATLKIYGKGKYTGMIKKTFKIYKADNPITVTAKSIKASAKKNTTFSKAKVFKIKKAKGSISFKRVSGNKKITISKSGKITVKKGLKKGKTYSLKVKVTAKGNTNYKSGSKTVTLKIKIK